MISHKHKFIFIQIPKTAGTSIAKALEPHTVAPLEEINDIDLTPIKNTTTYKKGALINRMLFENIKKYPDYRKFTFVRNPWDRLVSAWLQFRVKGMTFKSCVNKLDECLNNETCEALEAQIDARPNKKLEKEFEKKWKDFDPLFPYHVVPQMYFVKEGVDYVCRFENAQGYFNAICKQLEIPPVTLPHLMPQTSRVFGDYREYYNEQTREIVARKYKRDIKVFGYEF